MKAWAMLCVLLVFGLAGCKKKPSVVSEQEALDRAAQKAQNAPMDEATVQSLRNKPRNQGYRGYNEPLDWKGGIGLRAVASGDTLMISIKNTLPRPIRVEPAAIRLIQPGSRTPYEFQEGRDDLRGFPAHELESNQQDLVTVRVPHVEDMVGWRVVYNVQREKVMLDTIIERPAE